MFFIRSSIHWLMLFGETLGSFRNIDSCWCPRLLDLDLGPGGPFGPPGVDLQINDGR
jgi:hypothetical protein